MYQSIVKQRNNRQNDESNQNFLSGGKGSMVLVETIHENSTSAMKQQPKIKPRDLSSPYSTSFNQNTFQKKKMQSQSVEKYNQRQSKGNSTKQQWRKNPSNKQNKNQSQEEDNKELQTTAMSDLRSSQNNLQSNKDQFKRSTNSPTTQQLLSSSKQNYQQLASSVEYSTNHLHNISTTTTTTAASRGNSRVSKHTQPPQKKNQLNYQTNTAQSRSPKYYQSSNPNSTSINPWNINATRKLNFNQQHEESQQETGATRDKNYQSTQECSPENNRHLKKQKRESNRITGGTTNGLLSQKSIASPTDHLSDSKKSREIQSATLENSNGKIVKGIKPNNNSKQHIIDRTNSQNIGTTVKKGSSQTTNQTVTETSYQKKDPANKYGKPVQHTKTLSNKNKANPTQTATSSKQTKGHTSNNDKEAFNKKLNQKIQQKTFERSTNDINSASDTEYFEMSQKFSTIGDPRLFQIEHFMGGQSNSASKQGSSQKPCNAPKPGLKYANYKSEQKNQNKYSEQIKQHIPDDEIEEKIETESKNSLNNSPTQTKRKALAQEVEIEEINQLDGDDGYFDQQQSQPRITNDFKDTYQISHIPELNPLTMSNVMQKTSQEGHDGDHEDNSGDYTDNEKQRRINSTGISFTKPNLTIKRNESYVSDLQKTQDKIFQKYSNPGYNTLHQNSHHHPFTTQEEQHEDDYNSHHQVRGYQIDETQEDEFNQSQTRFLKDQISHMMISNLRPFTPPFQQVYQLNSSRLRQKQDSISSNHSLLNQNDYYQDKNQLNKQKNTNFNNQNHSKQHDSYISQNKSSISSHKGDAEIEVLYDDILNCYYDPKTNQYYELKA